MGLQLCDDFASTGQIVAVDPLEYTQRGISPLGLKRGQPVVIALSLRDQRTHFFDGHGVQLRERDEE